MCDTYKTAKIPSVTSRAVNIPGTVIRTAYLSTLLTWLRDLRTYAVLYVSHIGLTHCYKTVFFYIYINYGSDRKSIVVSYPTSIAYNYSIIVFLSLFLNLH